MATAMVTYFRLSLSQPAPPLPVAICSLCLLPRQRMSSKVKRFKYQRLPCTTAEHCCVPVCPASSRYNSVLSFFTFPADKELRRRWILAIRRDNFVVTPHTRVCSQHFKPEDIREPASERGRRLLRRGAVPVLFQWNNFSLPLPKPQRVGETKLPPLVDERKDYSTVLTDMFLEHNYALAPGAAAVDLVLEENQALQHEIRPLQQQVESLTLKQRFGIHRFAASDKDIQFFTRFPSYNHLMSFWALIEPSLPSMVSIQQVQRGHLNVSSSTSPAYSLQPIDELFLFLNYLALGSQQQDLADRYNLHQSTVSRVIISWSNFLYTVLGSIRIWIPQEQIRKSLPPEFKDYSDTTVILHCLELRCQCPSSFVFQSEVISSYKSHCTLKGLIGIAPHGAVIFISELYAGSISDKQITCKSGIFTLLTPGMAVMVDRGFLIDDIVPCKLYRAAFLFGRAQMATAEVRETQAIAHLRVHVERLIHRVKEHKFFNSEIPLSLFGSISQLYTVACLLTNYENGPPVEKSEV